MQSFKFIILCIFCQSWLLSKAQSQKSLSKCEAIRTFLSSRQVDSNFSRYHVKEVDTFFIIDMDSSLTNCDCTNWRGKPVHLITKGGLFDSAMKFSWPYFMSIKNQRSLYRFSMRNENGSKGLIFLQGYGSIISEADYIIKKSRYYIKDIIDSVE